MTSTPSQTYSITGICQQIRRRGLLNVPPSRFTPVSPYPQYTQFQLDMRRKAEVLKYTANASNTKTNNFTKAQKFSMLNRLSQPYSQQQLLDISNNVLVACPTIVQTPTSASDVPGPIVNLFLDPSIPLYNYATNTDNYGIINSQNSLPYTTYTTNDILFSPNLMNEFFTLYIHNSITQNYSTYIFETPVAIFLSGSKYVESNTNPVPSTTPIVVSITNVYVYVYYNDSLVVSNDPNTVPLLTQVPVISADFISPSVQVHDTTQDFSIVFYSGVLQVSNLYLSTQSGFIYDVKLQFSVSISDNNYTNVQTSVYANVSTYNNEIVNCSTTNSPSTDTNSGFVFTS